MGYHNAIVGNWRLYKKNSDVSYSAWIPTEKLPDGEYIICESEELLGTCSTLEFIRYKSNCIIAFGVAEMWMDIWDHSIVGDLTAFSYWMGYHWAYNDDYLIKVTYVRSAYVAGREDGTNDRKYKEQK